MKRIREIKFDGNFFIGSTITVTVLLDTDVVSGDTVKIKIEDPSMITKVALTNMTEITDNVFKYEYQNASTDEDGIYTVTIETSLSGKTLKEQSSFELEELAS
jgi:sRNA-binding carbon storage regulator CsrA